VPAAYFPDSQADKKMEVINIEARYSKEIKLSKKDIEKLPEKIALFSTVQFIGQLKYVKKELEKRSKKIIMPKPRHSKYNGQLLGCGIEKFNADGLLFIGDGYFHPIALALKNDRPVFIYNPYAKRLSMLNKSIVEKIRKRQKYSLAKFYSSENIGIIVSTKPGQNNLEAALKLKRYIRKKGKNAYVLIGNTINPGSLEDFNFIECFVNTACPRIAIDDYEKIEKPIINMEDIPGIKEIIKAEPKNKTDNRTHKKHKK